MLTTEECLLSPIQARNPGVSRKELAAIFLDYLGATNILWLKNGIAGDDTHGHVDDLARFVDPTTVVTVVENDPSEANYQPLQENLALLREMKDQDGRPLRIETLPMPDPVYFDEQRLPASYANFYIANQLVLVPTFNDARDATRSHKARILVSRSQSRGHRVPRFSSGPGHVTLHDAAGAPVRQASACLVFTWES